MTYTGQETIFDYIKNIDITDGIHQMKLANDEIIDFEMYNYYDDIVFDSSPVLGDNIPDTKMLILCFHKDLTINSDVIFRPTVRKKGMVIYCKGVFTNNGKVLMTARGAAANGQNVLLFKNNDGTFEFVPAIGAKGGESVVTPDGVQKNETGKNGLNGTNRQTGGGASGSAGFTTYSSWTWNRCSGRGGVGTSYSGGAGGAGVRHNCTADAGSDIGGAGGSCHGEYGGYAGHGGIGNPCGKTDGTQIIIAPVSGTGGLLVIYAGSFANNNIIQSNGSGYKKSDWGIGGGSGAGSINIFYSNLLSQGTIEAVGFSPAKESAKGGNGSVTLKEIEMINEYYLVKNNGVYKYYFNNKWNDINGEPTMSDYINYGMTKIVSVNSQAWKELSGEIEILYASPVKTKKDIAYKALPFNQIILSKYNIDLSLSKTIKRVIMSSEISGNGIIRNLISVDNGNTWLYYNNGWSSFQFENTPPIEEYTENSTLWNTWLSDNHNTDIEKIKLYGLTNEQLSNKGITQEQWNEILPENNKNKIIKFLTVICMDNYSDIAKISKISVLEDKFPQYRQNNNFDQIQKINQIVIIPRFNAKEIKINYIL